MGLDFWIFDSDYIKWKSRNKNFEIFTLFLVLCIDS